MTLSPDNMATALRARLEEETERRELAEAEIERLRGCLRGIVYKGSQGEHDTAHAVADRCLQKSLKYYPYPIKGAPEKPAEAKR